MASLLRRIPIAAVIVLLSLSATATARPCRSFIISSYSFRNPSSNTYATITEIRSLTPLYINDKPYDIFFDHPQNHHQIEPQHGASLSRAGPLGFSSAAPYYDFTSLRDRTKDILSVALALLFGLGCGALTAATMYLVWSVFSARYDYRAAVYGDLSDDDEVDSPKKTGYVKIPAAEAPAKGSV